MQLSSVELLAILERVECGDTTFTDAVILRRHIDGLRAIIETHNRATHTCGACGEPLQEVRPGKFQCDACGGCGVYAADPRAEITTNSACHVCGHCGMDAR